MARNCTRVGCCRLCSFRMSFYSKATTEKDGLQESKRIQSFSTTTNRPDPLARRPTKLCDPYGLGGKPLGLEDAKRSLATLDDGWELKMSDSGLPFAISRGFFHRDYLQGSKFVQQMAAVAHVNNHYPSIHLERRLLARQKAWQVVTTVECHTAPLQGLSHNDFYVAMVSRLSNDSQHDG